MSDAMILYVAVLIVQLMAGVIGTVVVKPIEGTSLHAEDRKTQVRFAKAALLAPIWPVAAVVLGVRYVRYAARLVIDDTKEKLMEDARDE
ncbi:hypothetical protein [Acidipropionibacterium acidipropionici]|nr:hypothetical protein [Acidipropionibacterium acidipropionici]